MKKTIMAVDDEPFVLNALKRIFREKQYHFIPFDSPVKAIFALRKINPHIIICDQRMPHIHGLDFLHRAKSISQRSFRIMLTGFELQKRKPSQHIDRFMTKPWDNDELLNEIRSMNVHHNKIFVPVSPTALNNYKCTVCGNPEISHEIRFESYTGHTCSECQYKILVYADASTESLLIEQMIADASPSPDNPV